jgi:hypothetical protein
MRVGVAMFEREERGERREERGERREERGERREERGERREERGKTERYTMFSLDNNTNVTPQ